MVPLSQAFNRVFLNRTTSAFSGMLVAVGCGVNVGSGVAVGAGVLLDVGVLGGGWVLVGREVAWVVMVGVGGLVAWGGWQPVHTRQPKRINPPER
jgi:hypothetical protein